MRPPFKNGGGKKGMRQVTSKYQKKIILRPAPAKDHSEETATSSKGKGRCYEGEEEDYEEEDHGEQYDYTKSLQTSRPPLMGFAISVSGCQGKKEDLLKIAEEYGAERHGGLQEDTTHLVTDRPEGAKYKTALERRMAIMSPEWLPAVREAWMNEEDVDYDQLEADYRMMPLEGVVFSLTHFAKGDHKDDFCGLLLEAGAEYTTRLDESVTHLIVASPTSPHSQTPSSEKLLHARRNRHHLHPNLKVVWEGWAREAIKFGGRREVRDKVWNYREGQAEPAEDLSWTVDAPPTRRFASTPHPIASTSAAPHFQPRPLSQTSRNLAGGAEASTRRFTGYDNSLLDPAEDESRQATTHDVANGKILKKRRRTAAPDASQGNPEQLIDVFGAVTTIDNPRGLGDNDYALDLPHPDEIGMDLPVPPIEFNEENMVYEMRDGAVGLQRTKKSKSAIKAITSKREFDEVEAAKSKPNSFGQLRSVQENPAGVQDDSGFFEANNHANQPPSHNSSQDSVPVIFGGLRFAVMDIKARDPAVIAGYIERGGGEAIIDASDEELEQVDWIIVDFAEPPPRFANSSDPKVVSVCWIELCLWAEEVVQPADRVLDRPIPYACPVEGAKELKVHFSGFSEDDGPFMHHNRRFLNAVGVPISTTFDRKCTHLILFDLENDSALTPSRIDASANRKLQKAREWGKQVISMREFRRQIAGLASEAEVEVVKEEPVRAKRDKGKGKEAMEEVGRGAGEEESMRGVLQDCVVYFSTKSNFDRQYLADVVKDLGGTAARQYSDSVTHFIHSDPPKGKAVESYKDLKLAKTNGCFIVHPRWVEECGRSGSRASELDFPNTFDSRKGGQLFDAGMSMVASPPSNATTGRISPPSARASRETTAVSEMRDRSSARKRSGLEFDQGEEDVDQRESSRVTASRSPTPRRRRSDSTRTEIAEPVEEEKEEEQENRPLQPATSSSSPATIRQRHSSSSSNPYQSSDLSPFHALSEVPPRQTDEKTLEQRKAEEEEKKKELLRQQTHLLMSEMQGKTTDVGKNGRTRTLAKKQQSLINGPLSPKKLSPTRTTSLPTLLPSSFPSHLHHHNGAHAIFDATQMSQSQLGTGGVESMCVRYDDPDQVRAREEIRRDHEAKQRLIEEQKRAQEEQSLGKRVTRSAKKGGVY